MLKCSLLLSIFSLVALGTLMAMTVHGAPVFTLHTQRSSSNNINEDPYSDYFYTALPSPPRELEEREVSYPTSTPLVPTAPIRLPFIKVCDT